ncbi:MAG: DUF2235 domain-containing protein [Gammaproteobacteria bacterium]
MPKRIVICSDGTWNTPDQKDRGQIRPSNVAKMALAVARQDARGMEQRVFYDKGVGTHWWDRVRGGAFGAGLSENIEDAYRFLVENYEPDDEIYLFGFSRGAYTARSTAGLMRNCGLLKKEHADKFQQAYALYRRRDDQSNPNSVEAQIFRRMYAHEVRIKCIGVWDTVGALGIPLRGMRYANRLIGLEFHDVKLSSYVDHAYQALAIDEKRAPFAPSIWQQQPHAAGQKLEQVWFAGVHTNVGGGYEDSGLSDITFMWMKEKAQGAGLAFDEDYIMENIHPGWDGELRDSRTGLYKLTPSHHRPIGAGENTGEKVHPDALRRYKNLSGYKPENLTDYLARTGQAP